ncbi:Gfo/Idh/MocA family oxidoreductase [Paenibacillus pinisoli]|nr:Gfo/Idh/MocA family oxidoreductase [Paenibacillus pinisoli]
MIQLGVLGSWNGFHVKEYAAMLAKNGEAKLVSISDDNEALAAAAAQGLSLTVKSHEELLADPAIAGVIVTAAPDRAAALIADAVAAGKAVLADKLIAVTGTDAERVAAAVRAGEVPFALDLPLAQKPVCLAAKHTLDSGRLGRLTGVRIRNAHGGLLKGMLPPHFVEDPSGLLTDIGLHGIYMACLLLGQPQAVTALSAGASASRTPETAVCVLEFGDGLLVTVEMGYVSPVSPFTLELFGTEGMFTGGGYAGSARIKGAADEDWTDLPLLQEHERPLTMLEQWLQDIEAGKEESEAWNLSQGIVIGRVLEAITRSLNQGVRATV